MFGRALLDEGQIAHVASLMYNHSHLLQTDTQTTDPRSAAAAPSEGLRVPVPVPFSHGAARFALIRRSGHAKHGTKIVARDFCQTLLESFGIDPF